METLSMTVLWCTVSWVPLACVAGMLMCSYMLQATRDGVEIGAARLDRLDAAANLDSTEAGMNAEARLAYSTGLPVLPLHIWLLQLS